MRSLPALDGPRPWSAQGSGPAPASAAPQAASGAASASGSRPVDSVELSAAAQQAAAHGVGEERATVGQFPRRAATLSSGDRARLKATRKALESGQPVSFRNSEGTKLQVTIVPAEPDKEGNSSYLIQQQGRELRVNLEPGVDPATALSRITNYISQYPPSLGQSLATVHVHAGADPQTPNAAAWVNGHIKEGEIHFQYGLDYLNKDVFDHEMGHVLGDVFEDTQAPVEEIASEIDNNHVESDAGWGAYTPDGWTEAIAKDNRAVSEYGSTNEAEDFAEFWMEFMKAESKGLHSRAMKKLGQKYPNRLWVALHVYHQLEYKPTPPAAPPAEGQPAA